MSVIQNNLLMTPEGYQISRSVRLRSSASAYLNRTLTTATNAYKWTWSGWVKRGSLGVDACIFSAGQSAGDANVCNVRFSSSDVITMSSDGTNWRITTQVFRDPSAWYHLIVAVDTTQSTAANRILIYVNGSQITSFSASNNPTQNTTIGINKADLHDIGYRTYPAGLPFDGYITEVNFIDGQALTPSSFGETDVITGVWKPKKYAGIYGTNGFYLNFSDNSNNTAATIGKDNSGNGNNWTPNNISVTAGATYDSMIDVPTMYADGGNGRGNYAVLNPLSKTSTGGSLSGGNLNLQTTTGTPHVIATATMAIKTKSYCEFTIASSLGSAVGPMVIDLDQAATSSNAVFYIASGSVYTPASNTGYPSFTNGDTIGIAYDPDTKNVWFSKNNTWISGDPVAGTGGFTNSVFGSNVTFAFDDETSSYAATVYANFGQRPFAYTPPTGFKALNTQNLPDATIKKGGSYFNAVTYTGNTTSLDVTGVGFQPDFTWIKSRNSTSSNWLTDAVRGDSKGLLSNTTGAEITSLNIGPTPAADGFQIRVDGTNYTTNGSGYNYVAWSWKESVTAGFDIVTYTGNDTSGRTVAHSLGVAPSMIIVKTRTQARGWNVYHASLGNTKYIQLSSTAAASTNSAWWNNTSPSSSVFTLGNDPDVNGSTQNYVAYLFAEVAGYSKFGSYTGNGSTDGPFVYCGFRPRFVLVKRSTGAATDWEIHDSARNTYNVTDTTLRPNSSSGEFAYAAMDFTSNGFKLRDNSVTSNSNGDTFIFAAFAENQFKNSLAR